MKVAIVISRKIHQEDLLLIKQLVKEHPGLTIFSNTKLPQALKTFKPKSFELYPEEKKKINYQVMDEVLKFGEKSIDGKRLTYYLTFEGASLWHYHKFRIYFNTRNAIYELTKLKLIAKEYSRIFLFGDVDILQNCGEFPANIQVFQSHLKKSRAYFSLLKYALFFGLRIFFGLFNNSNVKGKKHLLIDHSEKQVCYDLNTLKPKKDNYNLGYLFDKVDSEFIILDEIEVVKPGEKNTSLFKSYNFFRKGKRSYFNSELIIFNAILNNSIRKSRKENNSSLNTFYNLLESETNGSVEKLIASFLKKYHKTSLFYLFKYRAYNQFFDKYPFRTVASIDENSPRIKVILDAAKYNGIKTIGIQHGTIHNLHPAYLFTEEDRNRKIMPDLTLVWGNHWKIFLSEKGNYPESSLQITGQIRTDIIPKLIKQSETKADEKQSKQTILFASQPQRDPELRRRAAEDVFNSVKNISNTHLVIKLHPAEKNDFEYYQHIAESVECTNYEIVYDADLYQLISTSNIVVTCFSTVGAETTYFNKPLIILDHLKQDIQKYHEQGIAFQATNADELTDCIVKILDGNLKFSQEAYSKYVSEFAFKIDGKTVARVIKAIKAG